MQIRVRLLATAVALASFGVNAAPVYISTTLTSAETCSRAVDWTAPKVTLNPPELGASAPAQAATTPIVWQNFQSERQQFGYNPAFGVGPVSIAPNGRPILRDKDLKLWVLKDDGSWKDVSLLSAAEQSLQQQGYTWTTSSLPAYAGSPKFWIGAEQDRRVVFDQHCHAYTVVNAFRSSLEFAFLLHSKDGGRSWSAYPLPGWTGDGDVRMEAPASPKHRLQRPPVLVLHKHAFQAGRHSNAVLLFPKKRGDGTLDIGAPVTVADTVCCGSHSGNDTQVVADGDLVHFAYPGSNLSTDGDPEDIPDPDPVTGRIGTPQYVATYDRKTGARVGTPYLVGYGFDGETGHASAANAHSQPALALDSAGFLHVIISGHDSQMYYRKATTPHASTGWGTPEYVSLSTHKATYPSLLLDAFDRPHVIFRWVVDPAYRFLLVHRIRNASGAWSAQSVLLDPGRAFKVEWYHKATIDPAGRLFVSYSYFPSQMLAAEATQFSSVWNITITPQNSTCVIYDPADPSATRCVYVLPDNTTPEVGPGVLVSWDNGAVFRPTTTPRFSQNPPAIEPHRELYPFILSILSGN